MKKIVITLFVTLFIFLIPFLTYVIDYTPVNAVQETVIYTLPYPGILPDNPLYIFKAIRDQLIIFGTRDNVKKAQLYLLLSDKRIGMAISLSKKGKEKQAIEVAGKAEKYFFNIPQLLIDAKKQGSGSSSEFIQTLKLSNAKHREILDSFLKDLPQGLNNAINEVIKINEQVKKSIDKL